MTCLGSACRIGPQRPGQHGAAAAPASALTPAGVEGQLSLPRVWNASSLSRVCGTPALAPACVERQLSLPRVWNTSCGRCCARYSLCFSGHLTGAEHLLGQVREHLEDDEDKETLPLS